MSRLGHEERWWSGLERPEEEAQKPLRSEQRQDGLGGAWLEELLIFLFACQRLEAVAGEMVKIPREIEAQ